MRGLPVLVTTGNVEQYRLFLPVDDVGKRAERLVAEPQDRHFQIAAYIDIHQHLPCCADQQFGALLALVGRPADAPEIEQDAHVPLDCFSRCEGDAVFVTAFHLPHEAAELLPGLAAHMAIEIGVERVRQGHDRADAIVDVIGVGRHVVAEHDERSLKRADHRVAPLRWAGKIVELEFGPVLLPNIGTETGNRVIFIFRQGNEAGVIRRGIASHDDAVVEAAGFLVRFGDDA